MFWGLGYVHVWGAMILPATNANYYWQILQFLFLIFYEEDNILSFRVYLWWLNELVEIKHKAQLLVNSSFYLVLGV